MYGALRYHMYCNVCGHSHTIHIVMYVVTPLLYVLQCMGSFPYRTYCNLLGHSLIMRIVMYGSLLYHMYCYLGGGALPYHTYCNLWGHSLIIRIVMYGVTRLSYVLQCMGSFPDRTYCNVWVTPLSYVL